jgi:hypothetical protein
MDDDDDDSDEPIFYSETLEAILSLASQALATIGQDAKDDIKLASPGPTRRPRKETERIR